MREEPVGRVRRTDEGYELLLEREYPAPIERVWSALVEPATLRLWLAPVTHDRRVGGSFEIDFGEVAAGGMILAYDPPVVLAFEWDEGGEPSAVRFELEPGEAGTRLRLTHTRQSADLVSGTGPGWHAHLDILGIVLQGGTFDLQTGYRSLYEAAKLRYGSDDGPP